MEITARPRRRGLLPVARVALLAVAIASVALLVPPALGLATHVVGDDAAAGAHSRGTLVFDEQVVGGRLAVGDVASLAAPGGDGVVTRAVVSVDDGVVRTRGDADGVVDPWRVGTVDVERVVFSLPLLGHPLLLVDAVSLPPWAPGGVLLAVAGLLLLLRRGRGGPGSTAPRLAVGEVTTPARPLGRVG